MTREKLLIVDDERDMLAGLKRQLGYEMPGLDVTLCADAPKAGPVLIWGHLTELSSSGRAFGI